MTRTKRRLPKIWLKQVIYFLFLAAAVLLLVQLIFNLSLDRHLKTYVLERDEAVNDRIAGTLKDYYSFTGGWAGVQMTLRHLAMSTGTELVLFDAQDRVLAGSAAGRGRHGMMAPHHSAAPDPPEAGAYRLTLTVGQEPVGSLYVTHPSAVEASAWREQDLLFRRALTNSLLWAGLLAAGAAAALAIVFSRRLSQPLEALSLAVNRVARGDYSPQLPTYDSRELNELARSFNRMAGQLDHLEKLRRRSYADLSHELRTPLATLRSHIEAIKDGVMEADPNTLSVLEGEIGHLGRIVTDLDELARAESHQRGRSRPEPVDLNRFLEAKTASFLPLCREHRLELTLSLPEQRVLTNQDPAALGKIVNNLLANACRYTGAGGKISVSLHENASLDPEAAAPLGGEYGGPEALRQKLPGLVEIRVADNGVGIRREELPYIFERFYRVDPSRERDYKRRGTGIGLALVKELVRSAGGAVLVNSSPGAGTVFYLYLPRM